MREIIIALLLFTGTAAVSANDVYVSNGGSDDNAGTREKPFASLPKALAAIRTGKAGTIWLMEVKGTHGNCDKIGNREAIEVEKGYEQTRTFTDGYWRRHA